MQAPEPQPSRFDPAVTQRMHTVLYSVLDSNAPVTLAARRLRPFSKILSAELHSEPQSLQHSHQIEAQMAIGCAGGGLPMPPGDVMPIPGPPYWLPPIPIGATDMPPASLAAVLKPCACGLNSAMF